MLQPEVAVVADSVAAMDEQGRVINNAEVGALPDGVVAAEGFLWVANTADGEVSQIDPVTFKPIDAIPVGRGPTGIAEGFGSVWVTNSDERSVSRIDTSTGDVVSTLTVGTAPYGIAADDRWVWVTTCPATAPYPGSIRRRTLLRTRWPRSRSVRCRWA